MMLIKMWLEQLKEKTENFGWKLSADGEIQIGKHYVHGHDVENRVLYQFHGCFYHGCAKYYSSDDCNKVLNMSFGMFESKHEFCYTLFDTVWF